MTTTTSAVPGVIDYLVARATAALPDATVFDGPQAAKSVLAIEEILWVGHDPMNPSGVAAEAVQSWPVEGDAGRTKDEDGTVTCTARHWSGDTTIKVHRDATAAIVAAVELLLRGLPQLGGPGDMSMGGLLLWSSVNADMQWYQRQLPNGAQVTCVFRIVYKARLVIG